MEKPRATIARSMFEVLNEITMSLVRSLNTEKNQDSKNERFQWTWTIVALCFQVYIYRDKKSIFDTIDQWNKQHHDQRRRSVDSHGKLLGSEIL